MMNRHRSPRYKSRVAHAPYNFIPHPDEPFTVSGHSDWVVMGGLESRPLWQCHDRWLEGKYSGWIDLDITALAPLYVRCAVTPERAEPAQPRDNPARQQFFHHGDEAEPVIPGSTLRGMTRSLVEIMSRGKLAPVSDRAMFYRAVGDRSSLGALYRGKFPASTPGHPPKSVHAGYLVRRGNERAIQPAKRYQGESFFRVDYALSTPIIEGWGGQRVHEVWVKPPSGPTSTPLIFATTAPSLERGVLVESGHMGTTMYDSAKPTVMPGRSEKHLHCVVYERADSERPIPIDEEKWRLYEADFKLHRDDDRRPRELTENEPLFYRLDERGELDFFGPTMMFRLPYKTTIRGRMAAGADSLDLAEAMFGTIAGESLVKGRVFFEAAEWQKGPSPFYEGDGLKTPRILGAPKPTAFQMVLEQPSPDYLEDLKHWDSPDARVRGWKRYWHRKLPDHGSDDSRFETAIKHDSTQHTIIRPVRAGTKFSSRVRFENHNAIEVGALLTALQFPDGRCHQIGMGKPRGMGSARIETRLHLVQRTTHPNQPERTGTERVVSRYDRMLTDDGSLHSGELPRAEADAAAQACREAFESLIAGGSGAFWSLPEMRELDAMLQWDDAPAAAMTKYMELGSRWRNRPVLPLASELREPALEGEPPKRRRQQILQPPRGSTRDTQDGQVPTAPSRDEAERILTVGEKTVWKRVTLSLSTDSGPIRAGQPRGGRPAEATPQDFPRFDEIARLLKNTPDRSATVRSVTIERRRGMTPRILEIEW